MAEFAIVGKINRTKTPSSCFLQQYKRIAKNNIIFTASALIRRRSREGAEDIPHSLKPQKMSGTLPLGIIHRL